MTTPGCHQSTSTRSTRRVESEAEALGRPQNRSRSESIQSFPDPIYPAQRRKMRTLPQKGLVPREKADRMSTWLTSGQTQHFQRLDIVQMQTQGSWPGQKQVGQ